MSASNEALARRAVASKHWRWLPGMATAGDATLWPGRLVDETTVSYVDESGIEGVSHVDDLDDLPDFNDPTTVMCLLLLVRKAWGTQDLSTKYIDTGGGEWAVVNSYNVRPRQNRGDAGCPWLPTEAEALVAALEAAP